MEVVEKEAVLNLIKRANAADLSDGEWVLKAIKAMLKMEVSELPTYEIEVSQK